MPLEVVASAGISSNGVGISVASTLGSPVQGDYRLLSIHTNGGTAITVPAGWATHFNADVGNIRVTVFGRRFVDGDPNVDFTWGANQYYNLEYLALRGEDPVQLFDVAPVGQSGASSTSYPISSLSTVTPGAVRIDFVSTTYTSGADTSTLTKPPEMTLGAFHRPSTTQGYPSISAHEQRAAAGATGTRTFTANQAVTWRSVSLAVKALPPGPKVRETLQASDSGLSGSETLTVTTSTATEVGDILVAWRAHEYSSPGEMPAPGGTSGSWTARISTPTGGHVAFVCYTRQVSVAGAQTVSITGNSTTPGVILFVQVVAGAEAVDVAAGANSTSSGSTHTAPSVTTTIPDTLLLCSWFGSDATDYAALTNGMTELAERDGGTFITGLVASQAISAAGSTGTRSVTCSPSTASRAMGTIALRGPSSQTETGAVTTTVAVTSTVTGEAIEQQTESGAVVTTVGVGSTASATMGVTTGITTAVPLGDTQAADMAVTDTVSTPVPVTSDAQPHWRVQTPVPVGSTPQVRWAVATPVAVGGEQTAHLLLYAAVTTSVTVTSTITARVEGGTAPPLRVAELLITPRREAPGRPIRFIAQRATTGEWLDMAVPLSAPEITRAISQPGGITGTITNEYARMRGDDGNLILDERYNTILYAEEAGIIRAAGLIVNATFNGPDWQIEAAGLAHYPHRRIYGGNYSEIGVDPLDIVRHLWAHAQTDPRGDLGVLVDDTTSTLRLGTEPQEVDFTTGDGEQVGFDAGGPYTIDWWENPNIGAIIDDLAKLVPFDYWTEHRWNTDKTAVEHRFRIGHPRVGRRRDDLTFVQGVNIVDVVTVKRDGARYANDLIGQGKGEGEEAIRVHIPGDPSGLLVQDVYTDKTIGSADELRPLVRDELAYRSNLVDIAEITVKARHHHARYGAYQPGDDIYPEVVVDHLGPIAMWCRITDETYLPDEDLVRLGLARSDSYRYRGA